VKAAAQAASKPVAQTPEAKPAAAENNKEKKMITAEGRRDPFVSPVVNSATGPACSTGKRCLEIDQIVVRGVVKSETGMIAVVVNALNKAYFLKESDPVYNGYVLKITGDSVVFKETYQDKLGKEFTREIVKKLTTPAV
jgi:Tfp pilus assembly protein PilP